MTKRDLLIENFNYKLKQFENQKDSQEYKDIKRILEFTKKVDMPDIDIEMVHKDGKWWNYPTGSGIKDAWISYYNGKITGYVRFWKNDYLQIFKNLKEKRD